MSLRVYDTRRAKKIEFQPVDDDKIGIYFCGMTVQDKPHMGHMLAFVSGDMIRRYLEYKGYNVKYIQNFTDIDDKILDKAKEEGVDYREVAERNVQAYFESAKKLHIKPATLYPRATEHIKEILELISTLIEKGYAYPAGGDVYFRVRSFESYGKLSKRKIDDLMSGARIAVGEAKDDPLDFALWKASAPEEPGWDSPWGRGRPGWHIECSAMSMKYLGRTLDFHGGGEDLIFPHHENEMAQSCGATDKEFVRYWLHHAFVRIDQEKMAKSLGNAFAIEDVLKEVEAEGLRLHLLSTQYRSPLDFSADGIGESTRALVRAYETIARAEDADVVAPVYAYDEEDAAPVVEAMDDDFNTARAVAVAFESVREVNRHLDAGRTADAARPLGLIKAVGAGIGLFGRPAAEFLESYRSRGADKSGVDPAEIEKLIADRKAARGSKDWAAADRIRDELAARDIVLEDGPEGTSWKLKD